MNRRWMILSVAALMPVGVASAHHGWGSYDAAGVFTMEGPVEMLSWANPHAHLMLSHEGATWEATLAPLSRMQARGLTEADLAPGTMVSVTGYPSTRHEHEMRAERIAVNGKTVELR
jgi:hypothetical protein